MYCSRCGAQIPDGSEFCGFCGGSTRMDDGPHPDHVDPVRMGIYSFFVIGSGQMVLGEMRRGALFFIAAAALSAAMVTLLMVADQNDGWDLVGLIAIGFSILTVWVINVFDAINRARLHNQGLVDAWNQVRVKRCQRSDTTSPAYLTTGILGSHPPTVHSILIRSSPRRTGYRRPWRTASL